MNYYAIIVL